MTHIPVFHKEVIERLKVNPTGIYVDLTLGVGGHFLSILEKLDGGVLIGFELEQESIQSLASSQSWQLSKPHQDIWQTSVGSTMVYLVNRNFTRLAETLNQIKIDSANGILADLGWSTEQLERIPGLSFKRLEDKLDMRLDHSLQVTAADLLNGLTTEQLNKLFAEYADITGGLGSMLVKRVNSWRLQTAFQTTGDVMQMLASLPPVTSGDMLQADIAARVFQALRIAVNMELSSLQSVLSQAIDSLSKLGSLHVITFHSGEEKIVQTALETAVAGGRVKWQIERKQTYPSVDELRANIRARSARLWSIERI